MREGSRNEKNEQSVKKHTVVFPENDVYGACWWCCFK